MTASFPELELSWDGATYRCRPTFDCLAQIEQKVALQRLAYVVAFDRDNIPMTHISWVMYCLLKDAGAPVTPDGVWNAIRTQDISTGDLSDVMRFVIQETYGVSAESQPQGAAEAQPGKAKGGGKKRRRRRRSSSGTSTPSQ